MKTSSPIMEAFGWTLLHFLWQGAAVAAVLWLVLLAGRKLSSRLRYNIVALALAAMGVWPVVTFLWLQPHPSADRPAPASLPVVSSVQLLPEAPVVSPAPVKAQSVSTPPPATGAVPLLVVQCPVGFGEKMRTFCPWLVGLWALGVGLLSLRFFFGWRAVKRTRRSGRALEDEAWLARFAKLKARLGISRPVMILVSATASVPMVIGWVKPVVLVPAGLFLGLSAAQLEAILAHELAHIRRCDYLANLCQTAVETVLFYHPAVWWVSARLREEREHCCDDVAASLTGSARDYARALTALEEIRGDEALPSRAVSAAGGSLLARVRRLLGMAPRESTGAAPWVFGGVALLVAALAVTGAIKAQAGPAAAVSEKKTEITVRTGKPGEVLEIDKNYRFQFLKDKIVLSRPGKDLADPGAYATGPEGAWPTVVTNWPVSPSDADYVCGFDTAAERLWLMVGQTIWPVDYGGPNGMVLRGSGGAIWSRAEAGGSSLADMPDGVRDALKLPTNTGLIVARSGDSSVKLREWKNAGANFNVSCGKGRLSFGRSDGSTLWIVHGDVKLENEGDYTMACEPGGGRLWVADAQGTVTSIEFDPQVRTVGTWKKGEAAGDLGGMTAKVREALKLQAGPACPNTRIGRPGEVLEIDKKYRFQFLKDKIVMSLPGKDLADPGAYATGPDGAWPTLVTTSTWPVSGSDGEYVCGFDTAAERLWLVVGGIIWPVNYGGSNGMVLHGYGGASYVYGKAEAGGSSLGGMPDGVRDALKLPRNTGVIVARPGDFEVKLRPWKDPGANFVMRCEKGRLSFGRSDGTTIWKTHGEVKLENGEDYTVACEPESKRLWMVDEKGTIQCIEFDPEVHTVGTWKKGEASGDLGGMPAKVREALKLPARTAGLQPITDGTFTAQVLAVPGQDQVVILAKRPLTADSSSTSRPGAIKSNEPGNLQENL